ncbi:MAG: hypothetical protein GY934_06830, partial [Gammaproteobacteria bacterium]|nr:hypothetical protein [Gammaproteobacteria bacterium]
MPQHRLFKLEKLKIKAYSGNRRLESELVGLFEAMFNPESFKQRYEILYGRGQGLSSSDQEATFSRNRPSDLNLRLLLDGTGVHELGIMKLGQQEKVSNRVERFLDLTFRMNGKIHQPNYLLVEWGELSFSCRLGSVDINYTSFNRDGTALRAELDITLISDTEVEKRLRQDNLTSPDLT